MDRQLNLWLTRRSWKHPWQSIAATLLHYANASPPHWRQEFYALKSRLLKQCGTFRGTEVQEIIKPCWGPRKWNYEWGGYDYQDCPGEDCSQCGGTGIFDIRWVRLAKWEWCGFTFHCPIDDTRVKPERVDIHGRIEHKDYGRICDEAALWLLLLTGEWSLFKQAMTSSRACGWQRWPLLTLQQVTMKLSMTLRRRQCSCGRWYFPNRGGSFHCYCLVCRKSLVETEVPF